VYLIKYSLNLSGYSFVTNLNVIKLAREPMMDPMAPILTPWSKLNMNSSGTNLDNKIAAGTFDIT
jgi:hypothetical protein